jgi:exosome complex component RRP43
VRLGNTTVVCGVRAEILKEEDVSNTEVYGDVDEKEEGDGEEKEDVDDRQEIEDLRLLVPNVELNTGSTPQSIPGNAPSAFAQTLVTRLRNLLLSTRIIRARDLRILHRAPVAEDGEEGSGQGEVQIKGYWVLYIDTLFISLDGNAFDAAWLSILAALRDTILPHAYFDEDVEAILCSDDVSEAKKLALRGLPVPSTFAVFAGREEWREGGGQGTEEGEKDWVLSDPDAFEESVCRETVCVVVDCSKTGGKGKDKEGQIRRVEKSGGGVMDREIMRSLVKRATEKWGVWERVLSGKA